VLRHGTEIACVGVLLASCATVTREQLATHFELTAGEEQGCHESAVRYSRVEGSTDGRSIRIRSEFWECVEAYRAQVKQKHDASVAAANQQLAMQEAQERADAQAASTQRAQEKLAVKQHDPDVKDQLLSALLCSHAEWHRSAMNDIAAEHKYSAIGGAVNLSRLSMLQDRIRAIDNSDGAVRRSIAEMSRKPLSCSDPLTYRLSHCLNVNLPLPDGKMTTLAPFPSDKVNCADQDIRDLMAIVSQ